MSGPLAEWVTVHYSQLDPHARFVLVVLALRAKHDGSDADLTRGQISEQTGLSKPAISAALRRIADEKAIAQGPIPGRGRPRARQVRIWWCDRDCYTCDLLASFQKDQKVIAGDTPSRGKVIAGRPKVIASDNPLRNGTRLTGEQYRAMRWAQQSARRDAGRPGDIPPSPDPSRVSLRSTADAKQTEGDHFPPFQAEIPPERAQASAAHTESPQEPGAPTGEPFSNPGDGRLFGIEPVRRREHWR